METKDIMDTKDILTIAALMLGPTIGVCITLWHQRRVEKRGAKQRLFITLMAHRKSLPPKPDWVSALNIIDVVYGDCPKIVAHYHTLYGILNSKPINMQQYTHTYLEMLSAMARKLGYKSLTQTDIDKFYMPESHGELATKQNEVLTEFLRVLKASKHLGAPAPARLVPVPAVIEQDTEGDL